MAQDRRWDYKRPYHYMVTLKCLPNLPPLSRLTADDRWGFDGGYPLTRALAQTVKDFVARSPGIAYINPFIIMPDHLHLLVKLNDHPQRLSLKVYVRILRAQLARTFAQQTGLETSLFQPEWHDLIVKRANQLRHFQQYICNNAHMRLLRQAHQDYFYCTRAYHHWRLGEMAVDLVGNPELLDEPALLAIRISRKVVEGTPEWEATLQRLDAWKPGMTAVGTWWSKCEQAAAQRILARGGNLIHLQPRGFPERWHPAGEAAHRHCAEGRVLYLSPYPAQGAKLPDGETRARCLALNALALKMQEALLPDKPHPRREC